MVKTLDSTRPSRDHPLRRRAVPKFRTAAATNTLKAQVSPTQDDANGRPWQQILRRTSHWAGCFGAGFRQHVSAVSQIRLLKRLA
jgi:hypothetical protein